MIESDFAYKKAMLARFFSVYKTADQMGKAREKRLVDHLEAKRTSVISMVFDALVQRKELASEKRLKSGMASLKSQRAILTTHFNMLASYTLIKREKK